MTELIDEGFSSRCTGVFVVPARRFLIERFPLVRSFLADLDDVSLDLVSAVVPRLAPRQRHRVFVDVLDQRRSGLPRRVCSPRLIQYNNNNNNDNNLAYNAQISGKSRIVGVGNRSPDDDDE